MSYSRTDYWTEGLSESFGEHGITATAEQIRAVAEDIASYSEGIGMAFHQPEDPGIRERERLSKELEKERSKITCRNCEGSGVLTYQGPYHGATSSCHKCRGEGRHLP